MKVLFGVPGSQTQACKIKGKDEYTGPKDFLQIECFVQANIYFKDVYLRNILSLWI